MTSLLTDLKYITQISHLVRNFKQVREYLWNFSCPLCGDSSKKKTKARGYVYRSLEGGGLSYKCHNCSKSNSFGFLIKSLDESLYKQYRYDMFLDSRSGVQTQETPAKFDYKVATATLKPSRPEALRGLTSILMLLDGHPARDYIVNRKIPSRFWGRLYYAEDFYDVAQKVAPGVHDNLIHEPRIVIPFYDQQKQLMAVQGRSLSKDGIRYITIKSYEEAPKIYGMDRVDLVNPNLRVYIVEGPFDSMFMPNCIACAGADLPRTLPTHKCCVVYDNEPRNKQIVDKMLQAIEIGYRVCIWPDTISEKDINDMVLSGVRPESILGIVDQNSFTGLEAKFRLLKWKRC